MNSIHLFEFILGLIVSLIVIANVIAYLGQRADENYQANLRQMRNDIDPTH